MRGEVQAWLVDIQDRVSLARTCKALLVEVNPPKLPRPWRPLWTRFRAWEYATPALVLSGQRAFVELIGAGVSRWPGIFRTAHVSYGYAVSYPSISWQWRDDLNFRFMNLEWDLDTQTWETRPVQLPCSNQACRAQSLAQLPTEIWIAWREFVAGNRPRPSILGPLLEGWELDEDTPRTMN